MNQKKWTATKFDSIDVEQKNTQKKKFLTTVFARKEDCCSHAFSGVGDASGLRSKMFVACNGLHVDIK